LTDDVSSETTDHDQFSREKTVSVGGRNKSDSGMPTGFVGPVWVVMAIKNYLYSSAHPSTCVSELHTVENNHVVMC